MSKFLIVALIAAIAITSVQADAAADAKKILDCISSLPTACTNDATCSLNQASVMQCWTTNSCANNTNGADQANCIRKCKSTIASVQTWADGYASCVNGKILAFASMVFGLLVLLF